MRADRMVFNSLILAMAVARSIGAAITGWLVAPIAFNRDATLLKWFIAALLILPEFESTNDSSFGTWIVMTTSP